MSAAISRPNAAPVNVAEDSTCSALSPQAAALDALAIGIVLTDANGAILHRNRAAQEIMSGDGLAVRNNHVIARDSGEHELLLAAIKRMALAAQHEAPTAGELLTIHREAPVQRLALVVSPLRAGTGSSMHRPAQAMLLVRDPQRRLESPEEMLWRLFGLTPAEARLTHALVRGLSLKDAANELGVTRHTARDRLSAVFRKTEAHRQSELVQTVLNHPVWLVEMGRSQLPSV